jgi:hypothetical protein
VPAKVAGAVKANRGYFNDELTVVHQMYGYAQEKMDIPKNNQGTFSKYFISTLTYTSSPQKKMGTPKNSLTKCSI